MARRSLVTQLRTDGGPSHELLVQLDRHRVLTSDQLARLTGAPQRTTTFRLGKLHGARLVAFARPGRESGSSPRHWWLTAAGARLVAGVAPAEGRALSAMFAAHASLIAEAYLAVREHGPAAGIEVSGWWPDRQAWLTWRPVGGQDVTLSPDAIVTANLTTGETAGPAAAFVEIDLATMTQTRLRDKVRRYLVYAEDRVWAGQWPHCPPLLLLTTTEARAVTFLAAAAAELERHRRKQGMSFQYRGTGTARQDLIEADRLVIAACGHVRTPDVAVTDAVWRTVGPAAAAPVTLTQLLADRVRAQQVADEWREQLAEAQAELRRDVMLGEIARDDGLAELLGDPVAAAAYTVLVLDAAGDGSLVDEHPDLAALVLSWWQQRGQPGDTGRRDAVRARLRAEHERLLQEQIRRLLAAPATAAELPRAAAAAAALQSGRLLRDYRLASLDEPVTRDRRQLQDALLAEHTHRRETHVDAQMAELGRWARRRADPAAIAAAVDEQALLVCDVCAIVVPGQQHASDDGDHWFGGEYTAVAGDTCRHCGYGHLIPYPQRGQIPTLADRLTQLRARLT